MSKRFIALLALVALALGSYIAIFERASVTSKEQNERAGRVLGSFVRDKVEQLSIQRRGTRVVLSRKRQEDGSFAGFHVLEPFVAKADDDAVDQVLGELEWLSARRTLTSISAQDEQRFGLDKPRYRVGYAVGGRSHTLSVGAGDVHGESVYVRLDDAPSAYVVPRTLLEVLDHEPGHFRDKQLFSDLTVAWAQKLSLTRGTANGSFRKQGGRWWVDAQPAVYADDKRIDELLHALSELRAAHFLDATQRVKAEAAAKLVHDRVDVSVVPDETREDQKARQLSLQLAGPCADHSGEQYARVSSSASAEALWVCIADAELQPFTVGSAPLQEPRLFGADISAIESFVLALGQTQLSLARDGETWKARSGSAAERVGAVDRESVEAWLSELAAARALRFVASSAPEAVSFEPRGSLTLELPHGKRERIVFGNLSPRAELPVKRGDEPLVVMFPASLADRLTPSPGRFSSLEVWAARQPSEVVAVEASAQGRARISTLRDGAWSFGAPATPLDELRMRELVRALVDLRARSFVGDQLRAGHGVGGEGAHVKLVLRDGGALSLELGAATDRGAYARVDGRAVVEVGSEVVAAVSELAGGPRAPVPAAEVEDDDEEESAHEHAH